MPSPAVREVARPVLRFEVFVLVEDGRVVVVGFAGRDVLEGERADASAEMAGTGDLVEGETSGRRDAER